MGEPSFASPGETRSVSIQFSMPLKRSLYLDQIKAVIVALVIGIHVPMVFFDIG